MVNASQTPSSLLQALGHAVSESLSGASSWQKHYASSYSVDFTNALSVVILFIDALPVHLEKESENTIRNDCKSTLTSFEHAAFKAGVSPPIIRACVYVLCAHIDERVMTVENIDTQAWRNHSLLVELFNDSNGGQVVFQLLEHIQHRAGQFLPLLEVIFTAITFGFQGCYALMPNGALSLEHLRSNIGQLLSQHSPQRSFDFFRPVEIKPELKRPSFPWFWRSLIGLGVTILIAYTGFSIALHVEANDAAKKLTAIHSLTTL